MAVADDAEKSSPRTVVTVLALVPFVLAPMLALVRVAARALPYLGLATAWVVSVICAATVAAHLALGEDSSAFVFLLALMVAAVKVFGACVFAVAAVLLCLYGRRLVELVSGSGSEFNKSAFGAVKQESTQKPVRPPRAFVLGFVADLPCFMLIAAGSLIEAMMSSPVEGSKSQGEMIGSMIADVGLFGLHAISCFVIPPVALWVWGQDQRNREEPSQLC